ncbi:small multi-drug export protein [Halorhodospira halochloris]|uniref:small multi-drug export protein n=1 Tax=Halorhodospira halochloris TaxID=1052 RepID=UPI001EE88526|nr:small multi-drug export protein [Halorhodospira halochloris]MCG5547623.1 small multi-drug export protein [Halorhodospira halochloris]
MEVLLKYLLVLILAATPWIEILVVIPAGAAMGLSIAPLTVTAFIGNAVPVILIILLFQAWERRYGPIQKRWGKRAMGIWQRYGLPGIALTAPVITGIHLATVMALALGSPQRQTTYWMVASLAVWSIVTAALTQLGVTWITGQ